MMEEGHGVVKVVRKRGQKDGWGCGGRMLISDQTKKVTRRTLTVSTAVVRLNCRDWTPAETDTKKTTRTGWEGVLEFVEKITCGPLCYITHSQWKTMNNWSFFRRQTGISLTLENTGSPGFKEGGDFQTMNS